MMMSRRFVWALIGVIALVVMTMHASSGAVTQSQRTKRTVPVTNIVPKGAAPFKGEVVKVEVIEAVDIVPAEGSKRFKIATRIRNLRDDRVRCSLQLRFDGEMMGQPWSIDLPPNQTDLVVFACYCGDGKGADQLAKLTAEATSIRIGD